MPDLTLPYAPRPVPRSDLPSEYTWLNDDDGCGWYLANCYIYVDGAHYRLDAHAARLEEQRAVLVANGYDPALLDETKPDVCAPVPPSTTDRASPVLEAMEGLLEVYDHRREPMDKDLYVRLMRTLINEMKEVFDG